MAWMVVKQRKKTWNDISIVICIYQIPLEAAARLLTHLVSQTSSRSGYQDSRGRASHRGHCCRIPACVMKCQHESPPGRLVILVCACWLCWCQHEHIETAWHPTIMTPWQECLRRGMVPNQTLWGYKCQSRVQMPWLHGLNHDMGERHITKNHGLHTGAENAEDRSMLHCR